MEEETILTRSGEVATDVCALVRARNPLISVVTREEARAEGYLFEAALAAGYIPLTWDAAQGVADMNGKLMSIADGNPKDPGEVMNEIASRARKDKNAQPAPERNVWIMRDLPAWLTGPGGIVTQRQLRNLARLLPGQPRWAAQTVIMISPSGELPPELTGHATVVDWPLPDRNEIAAILDEALEPMPEDERLQACPPEVRDAAIDAAVGLAGEEAQACYARSLVQSRTIVPAAVANEKKRVIARERILEWHDPLPGGLEAVGGLDNLKTWLLGRGMAYSPEARTYGLPMPKGIFVFGVSGCGKSLLAKAIAAFWQEPLIKMDFGALKSEFVGRSENNLRRAIKVVETIDRCVLWIDEIEKAMQGATSGSADGGVSADALGTILTWMQERTSQCFVIATANKVEDLPPELLRKGRFDELWFVDLPNEMEREAVLAAALRKYGRGQAKIGLSLIAEHCEDFTGAEIEALVPDALYRAFADGGREITNDDLVYAARSVVPLAKTAGDKIKTLREWASTRARPATLVKSAKAAKAAPRRLSRALDL